MRRTLLMLCSISTFAMVAACGQESELMPDLETQALSHLLAGPGHDGAQRPGDPNHAGDPNWGHDPNQVSDPNWGHDPNHANDPNGGHHPGHGGDPSHGGDHGHGHDPNQAGDPSRGGDPNWGGNPNQAGDPNWGSDPNHGGGQWPPHDPNGVSDPNHQGGGHGGGPGGGGRGPGRGGHPACMHLLVDLNTVEAHVAQQPAFRALAAQTPDVALQDSASQQHLMATPAWAAYVSQYAAATEAGCLQ